MDKAALANLQQMVLYTQVRVSAGRAGGSGTVVYSQPGETYVLTCHHVVDGAISVRKEWDSKLGRDKKREYREVLKVEFFDYSNAPHGRRPVTYSVDADLVAYDVDHDMALLKLRTLKAYEHVAKMMLPGQEEQLQIGSSVVACGAALLHDPIITSGIITHFGDEMGFKDYWMSNAQIIYGNSGGAMFADLEGQYEFIGIPSRVAVSNWANPVTHLGYFSPIKRIYEFLDEQLYHFIIPGHEHESANCEQEREGRLAEEARRTVMTE